MEFAVPMDHGVKIRENEKMDKYMGFARWLKNLWNTKMTLISIQKSGKSQEWYKSKGLEKVDFIIDPKIWKCNIMAKGFRFMALGLVRLRTFRLSAWVT